jgi:hypothetical protein
VDLRKTLGVVGMLAAGVIACLAFSSSTDSAEAQQPSCHTSYQGGSDATRGGCIQAGIGDYDCAGGTGDGPNFAFGPVTIIGSDPFQLDGNDNDGRGCENSPGQPAPSPTATSTSTPRPSTPVPTSTPTIMPPDTGDGTDDSLGGTTLLLVALAGVGGAAATIVGMRLARR